MNPPLHVRLMTANDLGFADSLRAMAGWNQTPDDWRDLLALEPTGCFVAEWNGTPAGTATTTCYENRVAWIGMVLVHSEYRRRGIGKALLKHCIAHLEHRRVQCIKLDATPLGKTLYEQLGFRDEWPLSRWEVARPGPWRVPEDRHTRLWTSSDAELARELDERAFGAARPRVLERLGKRSSRALIQTSPAEAVMGFGMLREGSRATYLGPVVAASAGVSSLLIPELLAFAPDRPIYWDIPDHNMPAAELAKSLGFSPQRPLIRMFLGENKCPAEPLLQFAIADPAIG